MGTRSLTVVKDEGLEIITLYRQYDGYPSGHGEELVEFLKPFSIVNGLSGKREKVANGMGCLAAQIVAHLKTEPGGIYIYPPGSRDCGEEWIYTVYEKDGKLTLKVQAGRVTFFGLPGTKQDNMPVVFDDTLDKWNPKEVEETYAGLVNSIPNDFLDNKKAAK